MLGTTQRSRERRGGSPGWEGRGRQTDRCTETDGRKEMLVLWSEAENSEVGARPPWHLLPGNPRDGGQDGAGGCLGVRDHRTPSPTWPL